MHEMNALPIPITVITGFLGSGKTTLLSSLLKKQEMTNTAVIINEFGEVGLDHSLIEHSDENIIELQNGCIPAQFVAISRQHCSTYCVKNPKRRLTHLIEL